MIFQPVLHPLLLVLLFLPLTALVVWVLIRAPRPSTGSGAQGTAAGTQGNAAGPQGTAAGTQGKAAGTQGTATGAKAASAGAVASHRTLWALRLVLVLACFFMVLRPGIPGGATQTLATDTDLGLVVDTTASIVAEDWDGDKPRLDGVREDVRAIIQEYPGARFALLTFDAAAELRMPLTTDTTALVGSLDVLRPEVTSLSRGSSIGIAAPLLAETLKGAAESSPDRSRMVFYFGDGEQTAETTPEPFSASAKYTDAGAVLGYGTAEGGPMRITSGGLSGDDSGYIEYEGSDALSTIDEANLKAVADQLGVEYQHRTADAAPTLPAPPSTTTSYAESGSTGNVTELYWIAALVVLALVGFELTRATMLIARLRQLRAPRVRPSTGSGTQVADPKSQVADPKSQVADTKTQVADTKTQVADTKTQVADPKSSVADSKTQVADTKTQVADPKSSVADPKSWVADPKSWVAEPVEASSPSPVPPSRPEGGAR